MIWLLRDFDLFAVVLRAAVLAFEALTVGGVAFLLVALCPSEAAAVNACRRAVRAASIALFVAAAASVAVTTATLMTTSGLGFIGLVGADYFVAGAVVCGAALFVRLCARSAAAWAPYALPPLVLLIVAASVSASHAASRMDHRWLLTTLTAGHHVGAALWVGAMPFLLAALRASGPETAKLLVSRYSKMAVVGVALLVTAGAGLAWFYLGFNEYGSGSALYGTAYGVMLFAKVCLLLLMLILGAGNFLIQRGVERNPEQLLARLRRFSEAEIGLGFTAILAAASMTSQPPAVDLVRDRLSPPEIAARLHPMLPSLRSPSTAALTPPASLDVAIRENAFRGTSVSDANDRAWSEYNHHWAGLIVLAAGLLASLSGRLRWVPNWVRWGARNWPLAFGGLAVFILLRADPENWPLGPRPFWASFSQPDVLQHRLYAALILSFTAFEWGVQTGRWNAVGWVSARWRTLFPLAFPVMCSAGAALMLLHSHALGNVKEELLAEISHTAIALLGATAGWCRWLEVRLPMGRASRISGLVWPVCLSLAGLVLLNYRES